MSESGPLFREPALRAHARSRSQDRLLRISPAWQAWAFWVLVAALVGGFLFLAVAPLDHWVSGRAVVRGNGEVVATFPPAEAARIEGGQTIRLRLPAAPHPPASGAGEPRPAGAAERGIESRIESVSPALVSPEALRAELGPDSGRLTPNGPVVVVRTRLPESSHLLPTFAGSAGEAEIRVGRRTLLDALLPGRNR